MLICPLTLAAQGVSIGKFVFISVTGSALKMEAGSLPLSMSDRMSFLDNKALDLIIFKKVSNGQLCTGSNLLKN
jgi:hypothetical protein